MKEYLSTFRTNTSNSQIMDRKHTFRLHPSIFSLINKTLIDRSLKCTLISRSVVLEKLKYWFHTIKPQEITVALVFLQHNNPDEKIALLVETENQAHRLCEVLHSFQISSQYVSCKVERKVVNYGANLLIVPYSLIKYVFMDKYYYVIDFTSYLRLFRGVLDKTENKSVDVSFISHDEQKQQDSKDIEQINKSQTVMCKMYEEVQENNLNDKEKPKDLFTKSKERTNELDLYPLLQCDSKSDIVTNLLTVINSQSHQNIGEILLKMSTVDQICSAIKQSGCTSFLVQIIYSNNEIKVRKKGLQAMYNIITHDLDQQMKKQETKVYVLLDKLQDYTEALIKKYNAETKTFKKDNHPVQATAHLMKLTFNQAQRQSICQFGGIYIIANLVEKEHKVHGSTLRDRHCVLMRKYACMVLTNLTFDNNSHKSLLCSFREFMRALVVQLQNPNDELRQVTGSILRNLSWHADPDSKEILRQVGAVTGLMKAAMINSKQETLKSILSALWNLSAHCSENKSEICATEGALGFLVTLLTFKESPEALTVIENSSGILRNISSQIAIRDDYREILRNNNGLQILLDQLKSPSITVVGNVCGILWNLSAKCTVDQELLWKMGAADILKTLNDSENKAIATASKAALKNLVSSRSCVSSSSVCLNMSVFKSVQKRPCDLNSYLNDTPCILNRSKINDYETKFDNMYYCNILNVGTSKSCCQKNSLLSMIKQCKHTTFATADKYSNSTFENEDIIEQPVDYSQKYSESSVLNTKSYNQQCEPHESFKSESTFDFIKHASEEKTYEKYGSYAETDLDQPTDYSLRYAEDDLDSDICSTSIKNDTTSDFIQDTVKTYCTEGTPYETPFNFSTATSLTDLRLDQNCDKLIKLPDNTSETEIIVTTYNDDKGDVHLLENHPQKIPLNNIPSELSSGLMSPEKPINYCEEGTPGYFSRVSSFGSLESISANEPKGDGEKQSTKPNQIDDADEKDKTQIKCVGTSTEVKTVKFGQVVNYAEETPLMFSRSSSLASLDSIEQHSIHDDRSSIISDFSRLTSGVVSPSELPDSPTQTLPQSPKLEKRSCNFPSTSRQIEATINDNTKVIGDVQTKSVFEDNVTKFKEESTPIQFSTATSLSSLTIDDHFETQQCPEQHSAVDSQTNVPQKENYVELADDFSPVSEDEDMLAACISIGMQKTRHISSKQNTNCELSSPFDFPLQKDTLNISPTEIQCEIHENESVDIKKNSTQSDTVRTYCTEDTPIGISRVCSHSDLSVLSIPENDTTSKKDYASDSSSNFSGEDDKILAECIKSAMPKARVPTTAKNTVMNTEKLSKLNEKQVKNTKSLLFCDKLRKIQPLNFIQQYIPRKNLSSTTEPKNIVTYNVPCESPQVYCTEDTPVRLSCSGSQSDLSLLSVREDEQKSKDALLDEPLILSQNDSNMLDACIKLGMPKPRKHKSGVKETTKNTLSSCALNFNRNLTKMSVKTAKINDPKILNDPFRNLKSDTYIKKSRLPSNTKTDIFNNIGLRTHLSDKQKCTFNTFKATDDRRYANKSCTLNKNQVFESNVKQTTHCDTAHSNKNYFSDDSNLSGEDENILVECIKSAMPKPRETVNKFINNIPVKNETKPTTKHSLRREHKIFNLGRNNKVYEIERPSVLSNLFVPGYKNCRKPSLKPPLKHDANFDFGRYSFKQKSNLNNLSANCNKNNKSQKVSSGIPLPKTAPKVPPCTSKHNAYGDSIQTYCTEDTPALLSHAGSHSDLSILSITENDVEVAKRNLLEDECGNLTDEEDDDKILAACIKSAMPKPRQNSNLPIKQMQTSQKKVKNEHSSGIKMKEKTSSLKIKCGDTTNNSSQTKNQQTKVPTHTLSLSNESLNMSDFDEALLDQCIFSAMPKNNTVIRKKK